MTNEEIMAEIVKTCCYVPHADIHIGELRLGPGEVSISKGCFLDMTGTIEIGEWSMIGEGTRILTHDHYHEGRGPLMLLQKEKGVKWQDKKIGRDVWLHGCIILYQVNEVPTGTVVGIGSVLTKNPDIEYGIYAGNPARLVGKR